MVEFQIRMPALGHAEFSMYPDPVNPRAAVHVSDPSGSYKLLLTGDVVVQDEKEPEAIPYWVLLKEYLDQMDNLLVPQFEVLLRKPDRA